MVRNIPVGLDRDEAKRAYAVRDMLSAVPAEVPVTLYYTKRNGDKSKSTGTVGPFSGQDGADTMAVTVYTSDKGPRTINLSRIRFVEV